MGINLKLTVQKLIWFGGSPLTNRLYSKTRALAASAHSGTMPKDKKHITELQIARHKKKLKSSKYDNSGEVTINVLGSGARGAPRALYMSAPRRKYLFNCGEGTQRIAYEHKCRLGKLEHVFITSPTWNNVGGLLGLLLTAQDAGVPDIVIHAPKGIEDLFNAVKGFISLRQLEVKVAEWEETKHFKDNIMSVWYVPISGPKDQAQDGDLMLNVTETLFEEIDYYNYIENSSGKRPFITGYAQRKQMKTEPKDSRGRTNDVLCYICKLHDLPGKLSLEKCVEKGVEPGPLFKELKNGNDITLSNGTVVRSQDVCASTKPGSVFLVVECPSIDHLENFVSEPAFKKHQANASSDTDIAYCVLHFTPQHVLDDPRYRSWMKSFASTTEHIIINETNNCMGSEAIHKHQILLNLIHPETFPLLPEDSFQEKDVKEGKNDLLIHCARTLHTIHLQPETKIDTTTNVTVDAKKYIDEVFATEGFPESLTEARANIDAQAKMLASAAEYPKLLMLGTGSCIPNKTRNTSGMLLMIDEQRSMILDCGEGTLGQLVRFYGQSKVDEVLSTIKAIYVSHLHADHHVGLIGILKAREAVTKEPLYLLAPGPIATWLNLYHKCFEQILKQLILIPNGDLSMENSKLHADLPGFCHALKIQDIKTALVRHCRYAYGVAFRLENGQKIVYSGDTMAPSNKLITIGDGCDLLIHEATVEDTLEEEASKKCHSTMSQAIQTGNLMKSRFTLLTHFSQRYAKVPYMPVENPLIDISNVGIAHDNMLFSLSRVKLLPLFYPPMKLLFSKYYVELEERQQKHLKEVRAYSQ